MSCCDAGRPEGLLLGGVGIFNHKEHKELREKTSTRCCEASHLEIDLCDLCGELIEVIDKPTTGVGEGPSGNFSGGR
jgi:hypothetical protein